MTLHIPSRVAVIGAGIGGVVAAAHLKKEGLDFTVFERSSAAGGIWVFDERKPLEPPYPSVRASEAEKYYEETNANNENPGYSQLEQLLHAPPGPCYIGLKNNVGTRLLETTLNPFLPGTPDFVSHSVLCSYIQDTALKTGVHECTLYNTEVKNVWKSGSKWLVDYVTVKKLSGHISRQRKFQGFDFVVVASGHYHAARVPDIQGLADWKHRWPHRVQHSKGYRNPKDFKDKRNFLLIGGSVSSMDIARELGPFANNIFQSHRNGAFDLPASLLPDNAVRVDEIASFNPAQDQGIPLPDTEPIPATITLKSGRKLCGIHHVLLCTGYHISLPFLRHLHSDTTPPERANDTILVTDGTQLHNLHKDIFYIPDSSLVFVGVPYFTATFTLFEFQAMVVAKVLSGKAQLPKEEAMRAEFRKRVKLKGFGKAFHSLRDREVEYVNELLGWVNRDLQKLGLRKLDGHTDAWHEAKKEQMVRVQAMFAGNAEPGRQLELVCW
ncbi:FAD/NAD(P)-binding domain-containing protein [Zopfia rhizophila CBS 207.26]|uniref:FAD/NAD(P)-binding domain-containing protein n=1 Tax=Zopfia rhizophila CBS 207.26 TaxID=1314779 RepID=A0A6A6DZK3_9PEZI|nr:FAD/NAD(P)-binding domain-containing protein [Zopfia rhizophila CBS 207.26]